LQAKPPGNWRFLNNKKKKYENTNRDRRKWLYKRARADQKGSFEKIDQRNKKRRVYQ
jgi:hypothetical protein